MPWFKVRGQDLRSIADPLYRAYALWTHTICPTLISFRISSRDRKCSQTKLICHLYSLSPHLVPFHYFSLFMPFTFIWSKKVKVMSCRDLWRLATAGEMENTNVLRWQFVLSPTQLWRHMPVMDRLNFKLCFRPWWTRVDLFQRFTYLLFACCLI